MTDIKVLFEQKTILLASKFAKKAQNADSPEFRELQKAKASFPDFKVKVNHIKRNPSKECYKGLTYQYMRAYIATHSVNQEVALANMEELIFKTKCHSDAYRYPTVKKWFLNKYPEVKDFREFAIGGFQDALPQGSTLALPESNVA